MQPTPAPTSAPNSPGPPEGTHDTPLVEEQTYTAPPQNVDSAPFGVLVALFERLQNERKPERRRKLLLTWFTHWRNEKGFDLYPVLRLLLPQKDRERSVYGLKEKNLGKTYIKMIPLGQRDPDAQRLLNWKKPTDRDKAAGDFSTVLYEVVGKRSSVIEGSLSIDDLNHLLDQLSSNSGKQDVQSKILQRVYNRATPEEQRWIVRIILKDMTISVKETTIFSVFHPDAQDLYNTCSDLKKVAYDLWDPSHRLKNEDKTVQLFQAFAPMLCKRPTNTIEETVRLMGGVEFYIEEKLDGERMQLHKRANEYFYCSRKGKDYTYLYGKDIGQGSLTPYIRQAFDGKAVTEIVLDGEMLVWDPVSERNLPFGTLKTAALDKSKHEFNPRPCFKVFDILYLNGNSLLSLKVQHRKEILRKYVKEVKGRIEFAVQWKGTDAKDIRERMDQIMESRGEGLVIKNSLSRYELNGRTNGWIKVKPEYMDNMGETVDVVVVGGNYGTGTRRGGAVSTLICAVFDDRRSYDNDEDPKYSTFVRIGTGITYADYLWIRALPWKEWKKGTTPDFLQTSKKGTDDKGDLYLHPDDSFILKVKGAEIIPSGKYQYQLGYTMRFPRAVAFRSDLTIMDCMPASAILESLRNDKKRKMSSDISSSNKKRKITTSKPAILERYKGVKAKDVHVESKLLEGLTFVVLSDSKSKTANEDRKFIETQIYANGGICAQISGPGKIVIYGGSTTPYNIKQIINKGRDIIKPSWILDSISKGERMPLRKRYFFHATEESIASEEYDAEDDEQDQEAAGSGIASRSPSVDNRQGEPASSDIHGDKPVSPKVEEMEIDPELAEWFKVDQQTSGYSEDKDIQDNDSVTEDDDSDNADVAGDEEADLDDWLQVKVQEAKPPIEENAATQYEDDDDVKMGESDKAMEYDQDLIFKHLCFYMDSPDNAIKNGLTVKPSKHEADMNVKLSQIAELVIAHGGKVVTDLDNPKLTHVVVDQRDVRRRIELIKRTSKPKMRNLVISDYIQACLDEGTLLDNAGCLSSFIYIMGDLQVSPISQLLHTLGITREDLNKRSDQMRQFLTADDAMSSRVPERDNAYRPRSGSDLHSSSRSVGSSRSFARSLSRASSSSVRDGTPPATPVKSEPREGEIPHRRMDSMEMVLERQRRQRKSRREKERESSKAVPHPPSPSPSIASHSGHNLDSYMQSRDDVQPPSSSSSSRSNPPSVTNDPPLPITPQKSKYYRDHTNLDSESARKDTALKTETPTPTRASAPPPPQSLPQPQYYAYPGYMGYPHFMPMAYRPATATSSFPITPQAQRTLPARQTATSPLPPSSPPPASSPMSSPARRINLVSSPGPMGPAPEENEYDNLPYKLPPGPYSPSKPDLSYAALVGRAILSSPEHRLTLQEIYDWITIVYPHYKRGETTWMNSIRHVLSTTVCFRKVPRDRSVGRTLWAIYDEDIECFKDGGFKKHLCKDYVNGNDGKEKQSGSSKGKARARKRVDDEEAIEGRKTKKLKKEQCAITGNISTFDSHVAGPSFMGSSTLSSRPLFPPTRPTAHHQPYYQSCVPQTQGFPTEVIFPPLPAAAAFNRVVNNLNTSHNNNVSSSTTLTTIKDSSAVEASPPPSSSSPILSASSISSSSLSSSIPELTPNLSSSSPPSSLPATSDIDIDCPESRPMSVKPDVLHDIGNTALAISDIFTDEGEADTSTPAECTEDDIFNTALLGPVTTWGQSPKVPGLLQPGIELLESNTDSDEDSDISIRDRKGKKKQGTRNYKGSVFPPMPSSPSLNRGKHASANSENAGRPSTPASLPALPSTPPRSSILDHQISSTRTPLSHKGLHMSPSASLAHYKSNLDPPPVYNGSIPALDNPQADEEDLMRTPRKRGTNASAPTSFGPPVTPRKLIFSANLEDSPFRTPSNNLNMSPFRTPGSRSIFDPHDPRTLLDEELSGMHYNYDSSPASGLFGRGRGSLLYDSPGFESPAKWW
ncbi:DNA ligase 4 [Psilocybe cubensis]|uniref:DNA ligase 4 n=1 Tax=Psilocybe cubensis TaxID=181762 RepID=A0ACB8GX64_PSICU|nr:DNA ligase 4 [Psilocybe cubensis]KAH9479555.1 DNA ligase 4 [Psilocybe cubensis]